MVFSVQEKYVLIKYIKACFYNFTSGSAMTFRTISRSAKRTVFPWWTGTTGSSATRRARDTSRTWTWRCTSTPWSLITTWVSTPWSGQISYFHGPVDLATMGIKLRQGVCDFRRVPRVSWLDANRGFPTTGFRSHYLPLSSHSSLWGLSIYRLASCLHVSATGLHLCQSKPLCSYTIYVYELP